MATAVEGHIRVGTLNQVRDRGCSVVTGGGHTLAVFYHDGQVYALDNRCPHMGLSDIVLIAWGRDNPYSERKEAVNNMLAEHSGKTLLETNKHPSRGTYTNFVKAYSI